MLTVQTDKHRLRNVRTELSGGELVAPFECPARADMILARVKDVNLGPVIEPRDYGFEPIKRIHDGGFIEFLSNCWRDWETAGFKGEAIPVTWPARRMGNRIPNDIEGQLGYYAMAAETSIGNGTWEAAFASAQVALTAQAEVAAGARSAFALCRPPGHHAARDMFGGYCFLNNAAITAQAFIDAGAKQVAVLDVDFHHGNGTQDIFYDRQDVLFLSLHGEPQNAFPYFLGYADEVGKGGGEGTTENFPLPPGTAYDVWGAALEAACRRILDFGAEVLVVSLGVDTYKADPISFFKLESDDYKVYGERLARLGLPTLFVMEGGYAVEEIGINTVNVLTGFENT